MVEAARDHLLSLDFDPARIRVVKPGVDTEMFHPAARPVEEPVAVFCSPLASNKGIDRVLDAFRLVKKELPGARLLVAGRGPLEDLVRREASRADTGVELRGSLNTQGVSQFLREGSVFVTAPRPTWKWTEQLGLAYLEALATGLPIVTTRCGSNDEAVHPPNDLVADDVEALADALHKWLADPALRASVGGANRLHAEEQHDLRTQCAEMGAAFASVEQLR
jgi:glycosyltransferase involved in cell wall biosynthesis